MCCFLISCRISARTGIPTVLALHIRDNLLLVIEVLLKLVNGLYLADYDLQHHLLIIRLHYFQILAVFEAILGWQGSGGVLSWSIPWSDSCHGAVAWWHLTMQHRSWKSPAYFHKLVSILKKNTMSLWHITEIWTVAYNSKWLQVSWYADCFSGHYEKRGCRTVVLPSFLIFHVIPHCFTVGADFLLQC